ncbi:MAG: alpha/beta hydrolase-fold protein [Aquabacterium sp.]|uniref:alpha/beta hydrolase n=1 Tax=Aquabacterium sp. TaxID=1872578 RepID=UPI0027280792|nr:alpha/beta hydrolase [Aquabacterium sp.]MDO9006267.1 alpha/beta hydrolase-fold protein [Aquabacterium sp.]
MDSMFNFAAPDSTGARRAPVLLVMLPGAYDTPRDFIEHGFVAAVRERHLDVDIQLVDAHVAYYTGQTILERLQQDVIEPARQHGYRQIWLAGISIGGMGALAYTATHPADIAGVVALAPYLGPRNISADVVRAGGLRSWPDESQWLPEDDMDRRLWLWLKSRTLSPPPEGPPLLYWGYGLADRFALGHKAVAEALPADKVFTVEGGHDWPAWISLWHQVLDKLPWQHTGGRP